MLKVTLLLLLTCCGVWIRSFNFDSCYISKSPLSFNVVISTLIHCIFLVMPPFVNFSRCTSQTIMDIPRTFLDKPEHFQMYMDHQKNYYYYYMYISSCIWTAGVGGVYMVLSTLRNSRPCERFTDILRLTGLLLSRLQIQTLSGRIESEGGEEHKKEPRI